jgi:hypothetical protein
MKNLLVSLLFLCSPALVSCTGFSPVYGQNSISQTEFSKIQMSEIVGRSGFDLAQEIGDRSDIRIGDSGQYQLEIRLSPSRSRAAVRLDNVASRFEIQISASWELLDQNGKTLSKMSASGSSSFDSPASPYASQVAEQAAERRAIAVLADSILEQLNFYFAANE